MHIITSVTSLLSEYSTATIPHNTAKCIARVDHAWGWHDEATILDSVSKRQLR